MPTFARGVGPGTYVKVELEPVPQLAPTSFVTALIGRTSSQKPDSMLMVRNESNGWQIPIDQTTRNILAAVSRGQGEPRRMDAMGFSPTVAEADFSNIDTITDENGITHLKGADQAWVPLWWSPPDATPSAWVIDWVTRYRIQLHYGSVLTSPAAAGGPIELARVQQDPAFAGIGSPEFVGPIGTGTDNILNAPAPGEGPSTAYSNGRFLLIAKAWGTGVDRAVSFTLHDTDSNGDPVATTEITTTLGTVAINISDSNLGGGNPVTVAGMPDVGGGPGVIPASPTGNVVYGDGTQKNFDAFASYNVLSHVGEIVAEFGLKVVESVTEDFVFKFRVNITQLIAALDLITTSPTETIRNFVNVSVAGPATGYSPDTVDPGTQTDGVGLNKAGTRYTILFESKKTTADLDPVLFDSIRDLQDFHGAIAADTIVDALSWGCVPYFREGGAPVYAVPLRDNVIDPTSGFDLSVDAEYVGAVEEALQKLENVAEVTMVIVLSPTETGAFRSGIASAVKSHILNMTTTTARKPRIALLGARANTTDEAVFINNTNALDDNHLFYIAPATATLTTGGQTKLCNGSNIAAAIAGIHSDPENDAGEPMEKPLRSFDDIPDPFTETQKNRMGELNGVLVIEKKSGTPTIRHFVTSAGPADVLLAEGKIARLEIDIRRGLQEMLDNTMINTRFITGQTISTARSFVKLFLDEKIKNEIIENFTIDKMERAAGDSRQLDVEIGILPVFNLNWIYIRTTIRAS